MDHWPDVRSGRRTDVITGSCNLSQITRFICTCARMPCTFSVIQAPIATHRIKSDGNSFFRSLARATTGSEDDHTELHLLVTTFMVHSNACKLSCYLKDRESMTAYMKRKKCDGPKVWGTEMEIFAAAHLLHANYTKLSFVPCGPCNKW